MKQELKIKKAMKSCLCFFYISGFFILLSCQQETRQGTGIDLIPFKNKKEKWGYMDSISKTTIIPCVYDKAYPFLFNTAIVGMKNEYAQLEYGVIDTLGNFILPKKYGCISFPVTGYFLTYQKEEGNAVFDLQGKEIISPNHYSFIEIVKDTFALTYSNKNNFSGCYNLILRKEIIPCQYEKVTVLNNQLLTVLSEAKYAYFNKEGKQLTPFKYNYGNDFSDGLAHVYTDTESWFIDTTGKEVIPLKLYDACLPFNDSMAVVSWNHNNKVSIINTKGKIIYTGVHKWVNNCSRSSSGLVSLCNPKLGWGCVNKEGKVVIPFMYDFPRFGFDGDYALIGDMSKVYVGDEIFWENYKEGLIDKQNRLIFSFTKDSLFSTVSDSLICVYDKKLKKSKLVNSRKEEIIPYKYTNIETYNDSFFMVRQDSLYGLVDRQGREVLPPEYIEIGEFHEGLAPVRDTNYLMGFIDVAGHIVIDCKYYASDASNGYPCAYNLYSYQSPGIFKSGYTLIGSNRSWGYLDKKGNTYWIEGDGK